MTVCLLIWPQGSATPAATGSLARSKTGEATGATNAVNGTQGNPPVIGNVVASGVVTIFNLQISKTALLVSVVVLVSLLVSVGLLIVYQCTSSAVEQEVEVPALDEAEIVEEEEDTSFFGLLAKHWYVPVIVIVIIIAAIISFIIWNKQQSKQPFEYLRMLERHGNQPYNEETFTKIYNKFVEERKSHYAARKMCGGSSADHIRVGMDKFSDAKSYMEYELSCHKEATYADLFFTSKLDETKHALLLGSPSSGHQLRDGQAAKVIAVPLKDLRIYLHSNNQTPKELLFKYLKEMEAPIVGGDEALKKGNGDQSPSGNQNTPIPDPQAFTPIDDFDAAKADLFGMYEVFKTKCREFNKGMSFPAMYGVFPMSFSEDQIKEIVDEKNFSNITLGVTTVAQINAQLAATSNYQSPVMLIFLLGRRRSSQTNPSLLKCRLYSPLSTMMTFRSWTMRKG